MSTFVNQFLTNCRNFANETYHYDYYDTNEKVELQNIIVSGTLWSDSVSLNEHSSFYSGISFNFISIFLRMSFVTTKMNFLRYWSPRNLENLMLLIVNLGKIHKYYLVNM